MPVQPSLLADEKLIDLTVVGSGSDFRLQFLNAACTDKNTEPGCVEVAENESAMLNWELDSVSETYWLLTRLQFSADGENWDDSNFPLPEYAVKDFEI